QYEKIRDHEYYNQYVAYSRGIAVVGDSPILKSALDELERGLFSMFGQKSTVYNEAAKEASIIAGTFESIPLEDYGLNKASLINMNEEGYLLKAVKDEEKIIVAAKSDKGVLYAVHHLLRLLQLRESLKQ